MHEHRRPLDAFLARQILDTRIGPPATTKMVEKGSIILLLHTLSGYDEDKKYLHRVSADHLRKCSV